MVFHLLFSSLNSRGMYYLWFPFGGAVVQRGPGLDLGPGREWENQGNLVVFPLLHSSSQRTHFWKTLTEVSFSLFSPLHASPPPYNFLGCNRKRKSSVPYGILGDDSHRRSLVSSFPFFMNGETEVRLIAALKINPLCHFTGRWVMSKKWGSILIFPSSHLPLQLPYGRGWRQ